VLWRGVGCCGVGCSVSVCRRTPEIHGLPTLFLVVGVVVVLTFVVAVLLRLRWVLGSVPLCIAQLTMHVLGWGLCLLLMRGLYIVYLFRGCWSVVSALFVLGCGFDSVVFMSLVNTLLGIRVFGRRIVCRCRALRT